ncbi:hypothetical protein [Actinomadura sp. 9N407]|uniref:hypothetical protein n=1 Tax=Actinomadura sp. 9N407 TaxID=3375154 RepID=UPI00379B0179
MVVPVVVVGAPRNQIIEFGGLPVLDAIPSLSSWNLRESAAGELERLDEALRPGLVPDGRRDAERLAAAVADPGSVAWWLPPISWVDGDFHYTREHLRDLARLTCSEAITALVIGGTFDHLQVETDAEDEIGEPITPPRPQVFLEPRDAPPRLADEGVLPATVEALAQRAADFPNLRALFAGEIDNGQWIHGDKVEVAAVLQAFPRLEELAMSAFWMLQFRVPGHARLRRLSLHGVMDPEEILGIALCRLPALEHLELWWQEDAGGVQDPDERTAFDALFGSDTMPNLLHLRLGQFTFINDMVEQLASSQLLSRLHSLDLSHSLLTDKGARVLLEAPGFRGLQRLELRRSRMSEEMAGHLDRAFTAAGVDIDTRHGRPMPRRR